MDGMFWVAIAVVGGFIAWCQLVPDSQARLRAMIVIWVALPFLEVALFFLNRAFGLY